MIVTEASIFTARFFFVLVDATIKATLLLTLVTIIAALSRRVSASFRHLVWTIGLTCVLLLPLLSWNLPHWQVSVVVPATHAAQVTNEAPPLDRAAPPATKVAAQAVAMKPSASPETPAPAKTILPASNIPPETDFPAHAPAPNASWTTYVPWTDYVPWTTLAFLAWFIGAIILLVRAARGLAGIRSIVRGSFSCVNGPLAEAALAAASQMHIGRSVALRQASATGLITVPLTFGARRPVVVLPAEAEEWPIERLRAALLHEMAHIKRHDWTLQMLGNIVGALYWFNPLVWMALKRMRGESEAACDDLVLAAGVPAQDYARHLLDVALSVRDNKHLRSSAVAMAQGPKVEGRLRAILAQSLSRRPVTWRAAAGFLTVALLVALPLAALRLVAQEQSIPVPAANGLQLKGDFTLVYAVTDTNQASSAILLREYRQLRQDYRRELKKDPYFQPVPDDFYLPFASFQQRQTQPHHEIITVSSRGGSLFYQTADKDYTYARLYDGHQTQTFGNGHVGFIYTGLQIGELTDCLLPAVSLPYVPLLRNTTLTGASGTSQTWDADILNVGVEQNGRQPYYANGTVHAVNDRGTWKLLDTDNSQQQWQFFQHQRFQGLWLASQMRLTKYDIDALPPSGRFTTLGAFFNWFKTVRKPTEISDYRLLSASLSPPTPATFIRQALVQSAATSSVSQKKWGLYSQGYYFSEALHLRYHLQDWADKHRALLQAMSQASPTDFSASLAVGKSLRSLPFPLWQGDPRSSHVWDGDPRTGHDGQKPTFVAEPQNIQLKRTAQDFEFASSFNPGSFHVILWASGRITQTAAGARSQKEITPAFYMGSTSNLAEDEPKITSVHPAIYTPSPKSTVQAIQNALRMQGPDARLLNGYPVQSIRLSKDPHQVVGGQQKSIMTKLINQSAVQNTSLVAQTRNKTMKNNSGTLKTFFGKALVVGLTSTLFSLSAHSSSSQLISDATRHRITNPSAGKSNTPKDITAAKSSWQVSNAFMTATNSQKVALPATNVEDSTIAAAQEELHRISIGYQAGANSRSDVSEAAIRLAEASIRSATAHRDFTAMGKDLEAIVVQRQELLKERRIRVIAGADDVSDLHKEEGALAEARARQDLYAILTARQFAVIEVNVRVKAGVASTQDMDKAAAALQKAENAFVENGGV